MTRELTAPEGECQECGTPLAMGVHSDNCPHSGPQTMTQEPERESPTCPECGAEEPYWNGNKAEPDSLRAEIERLRAAFERILIGGNHIAIYRTERWPDYGAEPFDALEKLGAGPEFDMWSCWNAIMCARAALEPKP